MKLHFVLLLILISLGVNAQETDSLKKPNFIQNLIWDPFGLIKHSKKHPAKEYVNRTRKNTIYGQILGNTPYLGMGYTRKMPISKSFGLENGIGIGLTPHLFSGNNNPKNLSYSHHSALVWKTNRFFQLSSGYSGIFYSGFFYKNKMYNYIPSPHIGVRFGNAQPFSMGFNYSFYFTKEEYVKFKEPDIVSRGVTTKMLGALGISLNYSF
jgi:hypothetical protein